MSHRRIQCLVLLCLGFGLAKATAQEAPPPRAANHPAPQAADVNAHDINAIDAALKANDNFQVQQALDSAIGLLSEGKNNQKTAEKIPNWLHDLIVQRRFDDVEDFAVAAVNARPADLRMIEACQQARIRAKLLQNKPQEALALAKSLYDVCAMPNTSRAIDLISECLYDIAENGDPVSVVKKFKLEQIHGASTTQPSSADPNVLSQIPVDPKPYSTGLQHVDLDDNAWDASMGKGNLLLLSGQPREASKVFAKAYALASDNNLAAATEAVARAMRAEDGTVGRANAWILSLRPP
jgi:tetratricopeptide (TPR) repeat protein